MRTGTRIVLATLKVLFVVLFVTMLTVRHFAPKDEEFLYFASTIELPPQQ
jgi:hypothetical protein